MSDLAQTNLGAEFSRIGFSHDPDVLLPNPAEKKCGPAGERGVVWIAALSACLLVGHGSSEAACTACTTFQGGTIWGEASFSALTEASGLSASRRNPGVLWTHNDGSGDNLFALSTNGTLLATFHLNEDVDDLEDIAVGPGPLPGISYLYVGDIGAGSPGNVRPSVNLLRLSEPFVDPAWASSPRSFDFSEVDSFTLVYPDASYDAETLLVDPVSGDVLVATKQEDLARVYCAQLDMATNGATILWQFVAAVAFDLASAGDISADGTQVVLRREDAAMLWARCDQEPIAAALSGTGTSIPVVGPPEEPNGEAFAFLADGSGYVTVSEEEDPAVYFFQSQCPAAPQFSLMLTNQSAWIGSAVSFRALAVGYPPPEYRWHFAGQPLPEETNASLVLSNVTLAHAGSYEVIASNDIGIASSVATLTVGPRPDLRITEVQSVPATNPPLPTADWWELTSFGAEPVSLAGWRFNDESGGLTSPFVFPAGLVIQPRESIVFVRDLSPDQFRAWWGSTNVPASVQVIPYTGTGLNFGANGDGVRLWHDTATNANDTMARVDFGTATNGVSFNYDPVTGEFGGGSQLGVYGVFAAAAFTNDIGSPGRILVPATNPVLRITSLGDRICIAFDAAVGRRYTLEERTDLGPGAWMPTSDTYQAAADGPASFEKTLTADPRFYQVHVD